MNRRSLFALAGLLLGGSLCLFLATDSRIHSPPPREPGSGDGRRGFAQVAPPKVLVGRRVAGKDPARKRPWERGFLASLAQAAKGDRLSFELVGGEFASGTIGYLDGTNGQVIYVSGKLTEPEAGRFFFQKQSRAGVAGEFVGVVELPGSNRAYRIEPSGPAGAPELVERSMSDVLCWKLPMPPSGSTNHTAEIPPLNPGNFPDLPIPVYQNGIRILESVHGARAVIYLDFQGGYTPTWGGVTYARPAMSDAQIREAWQRVSEDFMPFNIDVTTDLRVFQNAAQGSRQRVIITPTQTAAPEAGGIAYIGSFDYTADTPCWVFLTDSKGCAEACSHEVGHALGLARHEGQDYNGNHVEYYEGQGAGVTAWAPIMGVGYYRNVTEWSHGEYLYADNTEDELAAIVSGNNGLSYRTDDTGDTLATSRYLELYGDYSAGAEGVIERTDDTDAFQFTTQGGAVSLRADPVSVGPNLALAVSLCDANDALLMSNCPQDTLWADLSTNLPAGTYTFRVRGAGRGNPLTNGFSSYASLGYYSITGSVANARLPDRFAIPEHAPNGAIVGTISARNGSGDPLVYTIASGNYSNTFGLGNSGVLTVVDNQALDYSRLASQTQLAVQFELFVTLTDLLNPALSEAHRRVVIVLEPVLTPPVITQQPQNATVLATHDAAFSVVAAADSGPFDALNYQWFFDGTPIAGATTTALAVSGVQSQNAGDYTVVITNLLGAVTSAVATLIVTPAPPWFTQQPVDQIARLGGSAGFSAAATGSEPITYQWQLNGTNLAGQTSTNLLLNNVDFFHAGFYTVVASNAVGVVTSTAAELKVYSLVAWGWNDYGQTNVPTGLTNVVQISAGTQHNLALLRDGTIVAWGAGLQTNVPAGLANVMAVAAGGSHSLALKNDGTVAVWGDNSVGQTNLPPNLTNVVMVSGGGGHSLALKADGTVAAWGQYTSGQLKVPAGLSNVVAVAAGGKHSLALKGDGTVWGWGDNTFGQALVPTNLAGIVAIATGTQHSLALRADGKLFAWGGDFYSQLAAPSGTNPVAAIAAGAYHNLALKPDGTVIGWGAGVFNLGFPVSGQAAIPAGLTSVSAIAAGTAHSLVLIGTGPPFITAPPLRRTAFRDAEVDLRVEATGALPLSFQWQFSGTNLPGATNQVLIVNDATNAGDYVVVVSNALGTATSKPASLVLMDRPPLVRVQPLSQNAYLSGQLRLQVAADGNKPMFYQWRFNGTDLPGATDATLILNRLALTQSGFYSVVITNAFGSATSAKANVQVQQVAAWGDDSAGQIDVPAGLMGVVQVAGGDYHSLALRADGSVIAWGGSRQNGYPYQDFGQTAVPPAATEVMAVAAGGYHSLALRADGTVVAWGAGTTNAGFYPHFGQSIVPPGLNQVVAIAAGIYHSVALKSDGEVVVWGGQVPATFSLPPQATNVVSIASTGNSISALRADGSVVNWGFGGGSPLGIGFVAIAPLLTLRNNGTAASSFWAAPHGLNGVVEIAGGGSVPQFLARKSDGTVVTWGATNAYGLWAIPAGLTNAVAVGCGRAQSLVALGDGSLQITVQPRDRKVTLGGSTLFSVTAAGSPAPQFQWQFNGTNLPGATNFWLSLTNLQSINAGGYSVVVGNSSQTLTSREATLSVDSPGVSLPLSTVLNSAGLIWITTGNLGWFGQTNITHNGIGAAQSGAISDSQQSTIETFVSGPGSVSFWWKVSSEQWFDLLSFAINGQVQQSVSGELDWTVASFNTPPGTSLLSWTYAKDPSVSVGADAGWLSEIVITTNPPVITRQPSGQVVPVGTSILLNVSATGAPPLWYQWLMNGTNLLGATRSALIFPNSTRHVSGQYAVAVSNPGGTVLSSNAQVLVPVHQSLGSATWLPQVGFALLSRDADAAPLLPGDLGGFEAQFTTNLTDWTILTNSLTLTNGALLLVDPGAASNSQRFYRIIEQR
jgi:alpha-tubulin suppressor-like RCC1 family protein